MGQYIRSGFEPAWWLRSPHAQTLWPTLMRRRPHSPLRRERFELTDGDFVDLDWVDGGSGSGSVVLVLHGLEGSVDSPYAAGILAALQARGHTAVLMHFRGCSGEPNRLPRSYHSGETSDLATVVAELRDRYPDRALAAVGYSLGGNVLLKWLGEQGPAAPLQAAVAVSVPFELARAADRLEHGFSRLYQWVLLRQMRRSLERKRHRVALPLRLPPLRQLQTFRAFDDAVTAPLHGFGDAADYYRRCSSRAFLSRVHVPTLILHARDDPFMAPEAVPSAAELGPGVLLELTERGGHVGFVAGRLPGAARYWLEERIPLFLDERLRRAGAAEVAA